MYKENLKKISSIFKVVLREKKGFLNTNNAGFKKEKSFGMS